MVEIKVSDSSGLVAEVVTALIRRDHMKPGAGKRRDLVPSAIPELGQSVKEKHQGSIRGSDSAT